MTAIIYKKKRKLAPLETSTNSIEKKLVEPKQTEEKKVSSPKQTSISPAKVKKIRAKKLKLATIWMKNTWPHLFNDEQKEDPKPLMTGVGQKINEEFRQQGGFEELHFSFKQVRVFLSRWTTSLPYLKNLIEGEHRYDINGEIAQAITEDQRQHAQETTKQVMERLERIQNNKKTGE